MGSMLYYISQTLNMLWLLGSSLYPCWRKSIILEPRFPVDWRAGSHFQNSNAIVQCQVKKGVQMLKDVDEMLWNSFTCRNVFLHLLYYWPVISRLISKRVLRRQLPRYYCARLLMIVCRLRYTFLDQITSLCICLLLLALYRIGLRLLDRQMTASVAFIICLSCLHLTGKTQHRRRQSKVSFCNDQPA